jgi:guanylate kinase
MINFGENGVIALSGPSGVGKGFTKAKIRELSPDGFTEPVVASTRHARMDDDSSRLAGLSESDFDRLVAAGEVVLPHQPFHIDGSPRYGFVAESLVTKKPILTEVHSSIIDEFKQQFQGRAMVIGMVATRQTLLDNILTRQGSQFDGVGIDLRVDSATREVQEIFDAYAAESVDTLFSCNPDDRDFSQRRIVNLVREYLGDALWKK